MVTGFSTVQALQLLISVLLPILVAIVTKQSTNNNVKAVVLLALSIANGVLTQWYQAAQNGQHFTWQPIVYYAVVSFITGTAMHFGLWKPTGVAMQAARLGFADPIVIAPRQPSHGPGVTGMSPSAIAIQERQTAAYAERDRPSALRTDPAPPTGSPVATKPIAPSVTWPNNGANPIPGTLSISGFAVPGYTVWYSVGGQQGDVLVDKVTGSWSATVSLVAGSYVLVVTQCDPKTPANSSDPTKVPFTVNEAVHPSVPETSIDEKILNMLETMEGTLEKLVPKQTVRKPAAKKAPAKKVAPRPAKVAPAAPKAPETPPSVEPAAPSEPGPVVNPN